MTYLQEVHTVIQSSGNVTTYSLNPAASVDGVHTLTYTADGITASDDIEVFADNAPTTPMIIRAMRRISVVFLDLNEENVARMTDLSDTQLTILKLSGAEQTYNNFLNLLNSRRNMRET